jgi:hypothetical protein
MSTDVAVNLTTGEILERLDEQPAETLAEALDAVHRQQDQLKTWARALEAELRARLKVRQAKLVVFGDWEVEVASGRESVWDAEALEQAMRELVDAGVVQAGDLTGIITRQPVVSRAAAKQLAARLTGDAKARVDAACSWKDKPGRLTVARSVALPAVDPPEARPGAQITPSEPKSDLDPQELFR